MNSKVLNTWVNESLDLLSIAEGECDLHRRIVLLGVLDDSGHAGGEGRRLARCTRWGRWVRVDVWFVAAGWTRRSLCSNVDTRHHRGLGIW